MALEQLALQIGLGVGLGTTAAVLSKLGSGEDWDARKLGYSIGIGVISAFVFLRDVGEITAENIFGLIATNLGGQFIINKGLAMFKRLKGSTE